MLKLLIAGQLAMSLSDKYCTVVHGLWKKEKLSGPFSPDLFLFSKYHEQSPQISTRNFKTLDGRPGMVTRFGFKDDVVAQGFEFQVYVQRLLSTEEDYPFEFYCFRYKDAGFFVQLGQATNTSFLGLLSRITLSHLETYLISLLDLFQNLETLDAVFVAADARQFFVSEKLPTKPFYYGFNAISEVGKPFYMLRTVKVENSTPFSAAWGKRPVQKYVVEVAEKRGNCRQFIALARQYLGAFAKLEENSRFASFVWRKRSFLRKELCASRVESIIWPRIKDLVRKVNKGDKSREADEQRLRDSSSLMTLSSEEGTKAL